MPENTDPIQPGQNNQQQDSAQNQTNSPVTQVGDVAKQTQQQAVDQAKQAVNEGLLKGVDQLKNVNFKGMLTPKANQPKVNNDEKLLAMVSYIPLVAFLALLVKSDSAYLKLHGRQGIILAAIFFAALIFISWIPFIGGLLFGLIWLILSFLGVFSAYNALIGNWWKIPVVGDLAEQIPVELFTKVTKEAVTGQVQNTQQASNDEQNSPSTPTSS